MMVPPMRRSILCAVFGLLMVSSSASAGSKENCEHSTNPQHVIEACTHLLRQEPSNAVAYYARGNGYLEMYELDLALVDFSKAIELDPKYADAYIGRGLSQRELDKAMVDFNRAIELDPTNARAYYHRVEVYSP